MKFFSRTLFNWICAILVFSLVCAALGRLFRREVSGVSLKIRRFSERKENVDILFIGSSRIYHGISPKVFDQTLRETGRPWHSFNVGMDGMSTPEAFALVRRLLALGVHKPKYVFFEVQSGIGAGTPTRDDWVKERDVYWRDRDSLFAGFRKFSAGLSWSGGTLTGPPFSVGRWKYFGPLFLADVRLWIRNATNFGVGNEIVERAAEALPIWDRAALPKKISDDETHLPSGWDGYFAMSKPMSGEALTVYRKYFAEAQKGPVKRAPELIMRRELSRFQEAMARRNIQVVFVFPPSLFSGRSSWLDAPPRSLLLDYHDVARYPQFYTEDVRLDAEHLNARGAEIFSRTLAKDFARTLPPANR
jgi:hypothetical protein